MEHFDDVALTDVTVIMDKDFYTSKKPSDFEIYGEKSNSDEHCYSDDS